MALLEIARFSHGSDRFELGFVERESTPEPAMKLGIRLHLAGLSLSNTILILDNFGVKRCRSTVHNWVWEADLQHTDGADPDHVSVDETVIQPNDEQFWLYAAVGPEMNRLVHVKLSPARNQAIAEIFLAEFPEKYLVDDALFLVNSAPWLQRHFTDTASITDTKNVVLGMPSNVSFEN